MGNYAIIVEQGNRLIAAVDKIRSYPVFYVKWDDRFAVSNSARALKSEIGLSEVDELSAIEFRMAGYVTGKETLYKHLYQLQAGEFLIWEKIGRTLQKERYYLFCSYEVRDDKSEDLVEELGEITDRIFRRMMGEADGAPIWVPLSGGLDSRLVLCKFKQLGYDNLYAFSYGPPGNYEARAAKYVADKIKVPWVFVPSKQKSSKKFFRSEIRRQYWSFSDGLCSIPFMQDLDILLILRTRGTLPENAILVNGQSGDFITGGHIPSPLIEDAPSVGQFLEVIFDRHYSLWLHLKTGENKRRIQEKVLKLCEIKGNDVPEKSLASYYESWEWQERQTKYVVNGQRIYDFLNIPWKLPLWDFEYLHF
ncbi:MAG: asparagine synthase-related protein [Desulfatiglandales bacterium]|nr:asparagine synthase-related protein [Desulfatiglandales bacterium]